MRHPARIGPYRIERLLGVGSFATVWLGHDPTLDARVAIKVLAENWSHDLRVRERFLDEGRMLWRLDHERLIRVHAVGELDDGRPYLVMDWAEGGSLRDILIAGPVPAVEALDILRETAAGVAVLHENGIVHRDLTPGNVLFRSPIATAKTDGFGSRRVVIADLGLAKALAAASGLTARAGTPGFMAPEQDHPLAMVDTRAGWIPDGLPRELSEIEPYFQLYSASTADETAGMVVIVLPKGRPLTAMPPGQRFMPIEGKAATFVDTESVNGHDAQCVLNPKGAQRLKARSAVDAVDPTACPTIQWQYAPNAWARASYAAPAGTTVEHANAQIRELAESVSLAADDPVRLPFTISGGRPGHVVARTLVSTGGGRSGLWYGGVSFVDTQADLERMLFTGPQVNVEANRVDPAADPGHTTLQVPNSTVDGHPAWREHDGRAVVVFPEPDLRVLFEYFDRPGDATTAVSTVHLTPTPDVVATWVPLG